MGYFSSITAALDWQAVSFMNELQTAYSERRQVIGQSSQSALAAGTDIQVRALILAWQSWLESNCDEFLDHTIYPAGETSFTYWDVDTWRAEAGIHANGFRRATQWDPATDDWTDNTDAMFTAAKGGGYGQWQNGDIIGPWVLDDVQKGFDALQRTLTSRAVGHASGSGTFYEMRSSGTEPACSDGRDECETNWPSSWTNPPVHDTWFYLCWRGRDGGGANTIWESERRKSVPELNSITVPTGSTYGWGLYFSPLAPSVFVGYGGSYKDLDGFAGSEGVLYKHDGSATGGGTSITADAVGDYDEFVPDVGIDLDCSTTPTGTTIKEGVAINTAHWVLDWDFAYHL